MSHDDLADRLRAEVRRDEPGPMDPRRAIAHGRTRARRRHLAAGAATLTLVVCGAAATASVLTADDDGRATDPAGQLVEPATVTPTPATGSRALDELVPAALGEALPAGPPVPLPVAERDDDDTAHGLTWGAVDGAGPGARSVGVLVVDPGSGRSARPSLAEATETCALELDRGFATTCTAAAVGDAVVTTRSTVARDQGWDWTGWPAWVTSPPDATAQIAQSAPDTIWYLRTVTAFRADGTQVTVEERVHTPDAAEADGLFRADPDRLAALAVEITA